MRNVEIKTGTVRTFSFLQCLHAPGLDKPIRVRPRGVQRKEVYETEIDRSYIPVKGYAEAQVSRPPIIQEGGRKDEIAEPRIMKAVQNSPGIEFGHEVRWV